jgi:MipA family protein
MRKGGLVGIFLAVGLSLPAGVLANPEAASNLLAAPGSAGLGVMVRTERSPYAGAGMNEDLVPLYLYEGERLFLHASRVGLKLVDERARRFDVFLDYRYEGFPRGTRPPALAGLREREPTTDIGLSYRHRTALGDLNIEYLRDALNITRGGELRLGYGYDWRRNRWTLRPSLWLMFRDARLNDYYYGVRDQEASASRPPYRPGAGTNMWLGLYGYYMLTERWRLLAGVGTTLLDRRVRGSPIVDKGQQPAFFLGAAYDFGTHRRLWADESPPLYVKLAYGKSSAPDCHLIRIVTLRCISTRREDSTRIVALEAGRPFIERLNGWPLDFVGYIGLLRHEEQGLQRDSWQLNAYMKAFYYGFPWSGRVMTRIGFGAGVSIAERVPYAEVADNARRGRSTSRLLNYLDPSIDFSVGDLLGLRSLKETYMGLGVSHRSGIFGSSKLLGNVNGGSNYIYTYVESKL